MSAYFLDKTKQKAVCINHMLEICADDESLLSRESERVNTPAPSERASLPASYESSWDSVRVCEIEKKIAFLRREILMHFKS